MKQETKKSTLINLFNIIYLASLPIAIILYFINL